jgi:hypothetical protein
MLNVRKLAAIDLYFLGPRFILAEFGLGVVALCALGLLTLRAGIRQDHGVYLVAWGIYMVAIGINYVPLLLHAIDITRSGTAEKEIADELRERRVALRKYRRRSLLILLPLVVLILSIVQEVQERIAAHSGGAVVS